MFHYSIQVILQLCELLSVTDKNLKTIQQNIKNNQFPQR